MKLISFNATEDCDTTKYRIQCRNIRGKEYDRENYAHCSINFSSRNFIQESISLIDCVSLQ